MKCFVSTIEEFFVYATICFSTICIDLYDQFSTLDLLGYTGVQWHVQWPTFYFRVREEHEIYILFSRQVSKNHRII
jgi:hypothetical protein